MPPQAPSRVEEEDTETNIGLAEPLLPSEAAPRPAVSRNVHLTLLYTGFAFAGRSIWSQSVLATFVYLLRDNNPEAVGYITAVMGVSQLVSSFPAGYIADKHGRSGLLRFASAVGVVAVVLTLMACRTERYKDLTAALAVWGLFWGVANTTLSALFADSIPTGDRSTYFTQRSILVTTGNCFGPASAMVMFAFLGDSWTPKDCATVMGIGQTICLPGILLLCFFRDQDAIQEEPEEETSQVDESADQENPDCLPITPDESDEGTSDGLSPQQLDEVSEVIENQPALCLAEHRVIPVLLATSDLISGLGSGMSIRYFPIFFVDHLKLSPVEVQVLYCVSPLLQAAFMRANQVTARRYGRCHVATYFKWAGICLMVAMIGSYHVGAPVWLVCLLYVLRTASMNSTGALTRSMLMDHVPRQERGKWAALESVNMFSWSGSAAVGGVLVGFWGLLPLFGITASIQFLATWPLVALFRRDVQESSTVTQVEAPRPGRPFPSSLR